MSFSEWSNNQKKKKSNVSFSDWSNANSGLSEEEKRKRDAEDERKRSEYLASQRAKADEDDIAPVKGGNKDSYFKSGGFSDGVDGFADFYVDAMQTAFGTDADLKLNAVKGAGRLVEGVVDLGMYGVAGVSDLLGADDFADKTRKVAQYSAVDEWTKGAEDFVDQYSILGDKSDNISEGLGQVGAILLTGGAAAAGGLGVAATTAITTGITGLSGMGTGMTEAYKAGASDGEAAAYGATVGIIEAVSELIFGGLGKGVKALGIGKGLTSIDDIAAKKISDIAAKFIASETGKKVVGNALEWVVKSGAEGLEEVISGFGSAIAKDAILMNDENEKAFGEILADENLLEQFVVGSIVSGIAQGGQLVKSTASGRDFVTDLSTSEQAVVDKEVEKRIAAQEADGKKLTNKQKNDIREAVIEDMDNGQLDIDTIESTLGGKTYEEYKSLTEKEESLTSRKEEIEKEISSLVKTPESQFTVEQREQLTALREEAKGIKGELKSLDTKGAKNRLSDEVFGIAKDGRLAETYRERARRGQAFEADLSQYKNEKQRAAVERAIKSGMLNNTYRAHKLVDTLSKIEADKGIIFDYTNNEKIKESGFAVKDRIADGYVNGNKITLNTQSPKAWQFTVGHEITHVLEGTEAYGELQSLLFSALESKGELESRKAEIAQRYKDIKDADYDSELTADLVGEYLFTNKEFIDKLTGNRTLFQKIWDEIKYLCKVATSKEKAQIEKVEREFARAWKEYGNGAQVQAQNEVNGREDIESKVSDVGSENVKYSIREEAPPQKTIVGYKVFRVVDGKLYPPMVDNPSGNGTPVGVWLNADVGGLAHNKDGSVKLNTEGRFAVESSQGGSLSFRPGWHLGEYPDASQFGRMDTSHPLTEEELGAYQGKTYKDKKSGNTYPMNLFPYNFVWAECEVAADRDYQLDAMSLGVNEKGSFVRSRAGLPYVPADGYYKYRTNPDPNTAPWIIAGAIKVNRILDDAEVAELCAQHGVTPQTREGYTNLKKKDGGSRSPGNAINLADFGLTGGEVAPTSADVLAEIYAAEGVAKEQSATAMNLLKTLPGYAKRKINFADERILDEFKMNNQDAEYYRSLAESTNDGYLVDGNLYSGEGDVQYSLSSIANTFYGDPDMTSVAFEESDYKQTEGYKNYVNECLNNMRQTRADFDEAVARQEIEDQIDGIVRVAKASAAAGYNIYDDPSKRDKADSKKRLLFSSLEPNSDYFTSNDISTICDKRKNFAEIYDDIVRAEEAKGVPKGKRFFDNVDNYFYLHNIMAKKGLTQPCRMCYVESMRKNLAPMANAFLKLVNETDVNNRANDQLYQPSGKNKGQLKSSNAALRERVLEVLEEHPEYGMTVGDLTVEMLTTEDGLAQLKIQAPLIYEAFNSFYGQSKPKMPKSATPFRFGELTALLTDHNGNIKWSLVDKINSTGGFRLQSYSDFQIQNFTDVLQVIYEAGTLGLNGHAYTKVPAFLEATEGTNLKRNISIFMYKDGNEWKIDRNDSFPYALEEIYDIVKADKSGNTSIIAVSQNKEMSAWIMANDYIGQGISFHKSGLKMGTVRDTNVRTEDGRIVKGYSGTIDHTKQQTEVWAKANEDHKALTKVKKGIDIYSFWDFNNAGNLSKNELIEKNVKEYIRQCEIAGYLPKFRDYVINNESVLKDVLRFAKELGFVEQNATIEDISFKYEGKYHSYTIPYGYYKFLGDFGMFKPDGTASPHDTLSLNNYDFDKAESFFADAETVRRNEILQQFANGEERQKYRDSDLTAEQLTAIVKQKRQEVVDEIVAPVQYSLSPEGEEFAPTGNYSTPMSDLALEQDIAPVKPSASPEEVEKIIKAIDSHTSRYEEISELIDRGAVTSYIVDRVKSIYSGFSHDAIVEAVNLTKDKRFKESLDSTSMTMAKRAEAIRAHSLKEQTLERMYELGKSGGKFDYSTASNVLSKEEAYEAYNKGEIARMVSHGTSEVIGSIENPEELAEVLSKAEAPMEAPMAESNPVPPNENTPTAEMPFPDEIAPMTEAEANAVQDEKAQADAAAEGLPKSRKQLHKNILDDVKATFSSGGFDFDDVLKKAKNLSTFSTVDNTPQRVMEKALGYKAGQILADLTVNKVAQNETEGIKWLDSVTNRKNGLLARLSKQYNIKPGSKESAAAQMYAEGFYVNEEGEYITYGDAELARDFPNVNVQRSIKGLASDPRIRQFYDETLSAINEARTRNAYPEIPRLDNYFLHFRAMDDTFSKLGLPFNPNDIRAKDLPTDLNGVTADLKPGQPYFASANHRRGNKTSHDLLGGLERYATAAKNQMYHIDDIQTLRALRNYIADTYGQANGLEGLNALTEEEAQEKIEQVYGSHLSTFAKFLNEEANVLAGKTALIDRGLEGIIGRRGMTFLDTVNRQVGSNMVGFNPSSSLTNFLPVAQTIAKTNKFDFLKAFTQTVSNKLGSIVGKGDSFAENSPVIIRRKGADRFYRTPFQKAGDAGYFLMSAVDDISTELIARTKFNELTRKGMDEQAAHFETDKWVSRLMGDRSLGQQPQLYNSKTLGVLTKFQLEVRNQLDSQFYDTIQEAKVSGEEIENALARNAKIAAKVTSTFVQLAVVQHLFGKAFESVAGYNPAFDIINTLSTLFGFDDDEESEDTVLDNIEQGFLELLEDLPYTSTFTGGRIPISSALPIKELVTGKDSYGNEKSRLETIKEAAPYYVLPGGYGQYKKTKQGLGMFSDEHPVSGSYTDSGKLRFPVEETPLNIAQAAIFGQYASKNAREYFDNDYAPLGDKQIQEYVDVDLPIADYWKYREGLSGLKTNAEKADYINSLDIENWQKNLLMNNILDRKEDVDMSNYDDYSGYEEFDFAQKNPEKHDFLKAHGISYDAYNASEESREAYNWAYKNPEGYALSKMVADDVVAYRRYTGELYDIKADKDGNGKSITGSRKEKVVEYINNLDADYYSKIILFKSEYPSDDTYNAEIIEYLNNRQDLTYEERVTIFTELGFTVKNGYIYAD